MEPTGSSDATDSDEEVKRVLQEELGRLPEKYRAPLVLCYLQGKTNEQAASELGWPLGSMAKRLVRGRELLRERMTGRGIAFQVAALAALLTARSATAVPPALATETSRAAAVFAVRQTLISVLRARPATLAERGIRAMFLTKLKWVTVVGLLLSTLGTGMVVVLGAAQKTRPRQWSRPSKRRLGRSSSHPRNNSRAWCYPSTW